jgi:hypothetical protein
MRTRTSLALAAVAVVGAVAHLRSRGRRPVNLERIAALDPQVDHQAIAAISATVEFPWDTETALSLALFRTYAVPTISRILLDSRAFTEDTRRRYDDTELLLAEVQEHGYDSDRGRDAIRRVNRMHGAFPIRPVDLAYVLSTFVAEPRRWIERFGWRPFTAAEDEAAWRYWRELGVRFGVTDLPDDLHGFLAWNREFEAAEFRYDPANHAVADATLTMYLRDVHGVPDRLLPLAGRAALSLLEPRLVAALGYAPPPAWLGRVVAGLLRARASALRWFAPPRTRPVRLTERDRPSYPYGYRIGQLGTFPDPVAAATAGTRDGVSPQQVRPRVGPPVGPPAGAGELAEVP